MPLTDKARSRVPSRTPLEQAPALLKNIRLGLKTEVVSSSKHNYLQYCSNSYNCKRVSYKCKKVCGTGPTDFYLDSRRRKILNFKLEKTQKEEDPGPRL